MPIGLQEGYLSRTEDEMSGYRRAGTGKTVLSFHIACLIVSKVLQEEIC